LTKDTLPVFLKGARARVAPGDVGLPANGKRRVPGLRREEVAELIGVSDVWYARFEAGRAQMSEKALNRLAEVLGLDEIDRLHLFRLARPELQATLAAVAANPGASRSGLLASPRCIGRARDLALVSSMLGSVARFVTIAGGPGVGKTTLAAEIARERREAGVSVVHVALDGLADAALLPATVASAFACPIEPEDDPFEALAAHIGDGRFVLVLDAVETVVDAGPALAALLERVPGLEILATGRRAFRHPSETVYALAPLALPNRADASIVDAPAVALFLERARTYGFTIGDSDASRRSLFEVVTRLEGIPLAIELIVPRLRRYSLGEIAAELSAGGVLRLAGATDVAPSLRSAIGASVSRLDDDERAVLLALATARGGIALDDLAPIAAAVEPGVHDRNRFEEIVDRLTDQQLAHRQDEPRGRSRFIAFDAIREYVRETSPAALRDAAEAAQAQRFLDVARDAQQRFEALSGGDVLETFDAERDNIRAALDALTERDVERALGLANTCARYWHVRGMAREAVTRLESLLERAHTENDETLSGTANAAVFALALRDYQRAIRLGLRTCAAYRRRGETLRLARARGNLGTVCSALGQHRRAAALFRYAAEAHGAAQHRVGYANNMTNLGWSLLQAGEHHASRDAFVDALEHKRATGSDWEIAKTLGALAHVELALGNVPRAKARLVEVLPVYERHGDNSGYANTLDGLASALLSEGRPESAAWLAGYANEYRATHRAPASESERVRHETTLAACVRAIGEQRCLILTGEGARARPSQLRTLLGMRAP